MSAAVAAAAAASAMNHHASSSSFPVAAADPAAGSPPSTISPSRYESQKRRDWNTFGQYLKNHRPPLALARCSGAHVLEFLRYLDQFGKTKVHSVGCPFFGHPHPPAPCPCPLRQAWGSLDALVGRLRAAFEEHGGPPEANPFGARAVRLYLLEVRDVQSKARGIAYEKKRKRPPPPAPPASLSAVLLPSVLIPPHHSQLSAVVAPAGSQHPFFLGRHHQFDVGVGGGGGEEADAGARAAAMILPLSILN